MSFLEFLNLSGDDSLKRNVDSALRLDNRLFEICMYEVTQGLRSMDFDNVNIIIDSMRKAIVLFNFYKKRIKDGEFSLNDLDEIIATKYGLVNKSYKFLECNDETIDNIDEIVQLLIEEEEQLKELINKKLVNKSDITNRPSNLEKMSLVLGPSMPIENLNTSVSPNNDIQKINEDMDFLYEKFTDLNNELDSLKSQLDSKKRKKKD